MPSFLRPRARPGRRRGTDQRPRFHAPRGLLAQIGRSPHLATSRARPVVRPPVVETVDPEYRVLMNAGKAPPVVAGPIRRPANFEDGSPLAAPLRPAIRGKRHHAGIAFASGRRWCARAHRRHSAGPDPAARPSRRAFPLAQIRACAASARHDCFCACAANARVIAMAATMESFVPQGGARIGEPCAETCSWRPAGKQSSVASVALWSLRVLSGTASPTCRDRSDGAARSDGGDAVGTSLLAGAGGDSAMRFVRVLALASVGR